MPLGTYSEIRVTKIPFSLKRFWRFLRVEKWLTPYGFWRGLAGAFYLSSHKFMLGRKDIFEGD